MGNNYNTNNYLKKNDNYIPQWQLNQKGLCNPNVLFRSCIPYEFSLIGNRKNINTFYRIMMNGDIIDIYLGDANIYHKDISNYYPIAILDSSNTLWFDYVEKIPAIEKNYTIYYHYKCIQIYTKKIYKENVWNTKTNIYDSDAKEWANDGIEEVRFSDSFYNYKIQKCNNLFSLCKNLKNIDFYNFNTDDVTTMDRMFYLCENLETLQNIELLNFEKVTDISYMFSGCNKIQNIDLNWNLTNVKNMDSLFSECYELQSVDIEDTINTSKVTNMSHLFNNCTNLQNINNIENLNTEHCKDFAYMFHNCSSLQSIDINKWNMNSAVKLDHLFSGCSNITEIDLSELELNRETLKSVSSLFHGCSRLSKIYITENTFNFRNTLSTSYMFSECESLVGEVGTKYNNLMTDGKMAHIDDYMNNGYCSNIETKRQKEYEENAMKGEY